MAKVIVYGAYDNEGEAAYLYNGGWYPTDFKRLSEVVAAGVVERSATMCRCSDEEALSLGLDNPTGVVKYEVEL